MRARLQLTRHWVPEASALGQDITYQCAMHSSVIYAYLPIEPHTSNFDDQESCAGKARFDIGRNRMPTGMAAFPPLAP